MSLGISTGRFIRVIVTLAPFEETVIPDMAVLPENGDMLPLEAGDAAIICGAATGMAVAGMSELRMISARACSVYISDASKTAERSAT